LLKLGLNKNDFYSSNNMNASKEIKHKGRTGPTTSPEGGLLG
jgi:hypothetical protein